MITIYILEGENRRYVGITKDLPRRLSEHAKNSHSGRLIGKFAVLHQEQASSYAEARQREKFLKSGQGRAWLAEKYPKR
ncbi:MAG: GIY-YIG nuclease family protein [Opitutaceae bacterium]|nr:GIY-YIG nuclease family protein [Opitutaceae bacterium]